MGLGIGSAAAQRREIYTSAKFKALAKDHRTLALLPLTVNTNDGKTGELLWKYDKSLSRGLGSNTSTIVMVIMRKASRQFPYSKEFKS